MVVHRCYTCKRNVVHCAIKLDTIMMVTNNKDMNDLINKLKRMQWRVVLAKKHLKLLPPDSQNTMFVVSKTPSDIRAYRNFKNQIKRYVGYAV